MPSRQPTSYPQRFYQPPADACQLILVRHGQSAPYVPGQPFPLVDGHADPTLSPKGEHQAVLLANRLENEGIDAIYTSALTRTKQTAAPLAQRLGISPIERADLNEVFLGEGEGGYLRQMLADGHPRAKQAAETGEWGSLEGAESSAELTERTVRGVRAIAASHPDQLVVVVCHGGVIAALLSYAAGSTSKAFRFARHTSINHLVLPSPETEPAEWVIRSFNDGAHAGPLTSDFEPPRST